MSNPPPSSDDELLSAYLDGELSAEERAALEQRLENDGAARQTLAELRQLSAAVQALPAETLGYDLRQRVLQRVAQPATTAATKTAKTMPNSAPNSAPSRDDVRGWRRGLAWASLAIAATLFLMVFRSDQLKDKRQLAAVDKQAENKPKSLQRQASKPRELQMRAVQDEARDIDEPAAPAAAGEGAANLAAEPVFEAAGVQPPRVKLQGAKQGDQLPGLATIELTVPTTSEQQLSVSAAFGQLLARHDVKLSKRKLAARELPQERLHEEQEKSAADQTDLERAETTTAETYAYARGAAQPAKQSQSELHREGAETRSAGEPVSEAAVLVEATPEQIRSILAACRAAPELFAQVDQLSSKRDLAETAASAVPPNDVQAKTLAAKAPAAKGRAWVLESQDNEFVSRGFGGGFGNREAKSVPSESVLARRWDVAPEKVTTGSVRVLFLLRRENPN